jgi:uncharacterized protein YndB with AHSA1/START domain
MAEVRLEIDLAHPRERVWRALTDARLLSEWLMPTDLEPRECAEFTLEPGTLAGFLGTVSGELTELVPPHRIVMLWQGEKLHTRVTWELTETDRGCTLQVVQTGFIGAPATLRRRALRDTYSRLFGEQLPAVLDRLAAVPSALLAGTQPAVSTAGAEVEVGGADPPAAAVPRQRRAPVNTAVGAWATGRSLGRQATGDSPPPDPIPEDAALPTAGAPPAPVVPAPRRAGDAEPGATPSGLERLVRPAWLGRLGSAPGWARAVVVGAAAAVLAVTVLAAVVYTPGSDVGGEGPGAGPDAERDAPGVALQPGGVTSHSTPAESADPVAPESLPPGGTPDTPGAPSQSGEGGPATTPGAGGPPEGTAPPANPTAASPPPVLTAQLSTSDRLLLGLGGRAVTVTVSNPGPGNTTDWEVAMDVGDQEVTNVSGADFEQDGSQVIFTPADAELVAGASTQFSFDLPGLLGASDPTDCTINGRPCD